MRRLFVRKHLWTVPEPLVKASRTNFQLLTPKPERVITPTNILKWYLGFGHSIFSQGIIFTLLVYQNLLKQDSHICESPTYVVFRAINSRLPDHWAHRRPWRRLLDLWPQEQIAWAILGLWPVGLLHQGRGTHCEPPLFQSANWSALYVKEEKEVKIQTTDSNDHQLI